MSTHEKIYVDQAEAYESMVSKQPDLTEYINEIRPFHGLDVLDLGAGSGRLSTVLAKDAKSLICTDISPSMLALLGNKLTDQGVARNWSTLVADHRELPVADSTIDLVVSGWSICYLTNSGQEEWKGNLENIISELERVLKPGGTMIIFETMGTGTENPNPPDFLKPYYQALTQQYGFQHRWIRVDYQFSSVKEAKESTTFFFGDELSQKIAENEWSIVPECAGIWWKHVPGE